MSNMDFNNNIHRIQDSTQQPIVSPANEDIPVMSLADYVRSVGGSEVSLTLIVDLNRLKEITGRSNLRPPVRVEETPTVLSYNEVPIDPKNVKIPKDNIVKITEAMTDFLLRIHSGAVTGFDKTLSDIRLKLAVIPEKKLQQQVSAFCLYLIQVLQDCDSNREVSAGETDSSTESVVHAREHISELAVGALGMILVEESRYDCFKAYKNLHDSLCCRNCRLGEGLEVSPEFYLISKAIDEASRRVNQVSDDEDTPLSKLLRNSPIDLSSVNLEKHMEKLDSMISES